MGNACFEFASGIAAAFTYTVRGVTQTKLLTRQLFAPSAARLCAPSRLVKNSFNLDAEGWTTLGAGGFNRKPSNFYTTSRDTTDAVDTHRRNGVNTA